MSLEQTRPGARILTERRYIQTKSYGTIEPSSSANALVRCYRQSDRESVRRICCDTGFLGQPIDNIFRDRELFADLFTAPYLICEPQWAFVAEADNRVVGYLLGSVSPLFAQFQMRSGFHTACKMVARLILGRYANHARSRQFVMWTLLKSYFERPHHPPNAAHLHFNIDKAYRGKDLGKLMWQAFERALKSAQIDRCYGEFFSCSRRHPERVYSRYGFKVFGQTQTTMFSPEIPGDVFIVCMYKIF